MQIILVIAECMGTDGNYSRVRLQFVLHKKEKGELAKSY